MNLTTNDLRFLAEEVLKNTNFNPEEFGLDDMYLRDMRDALLKMVTQLEKTGEVELTISSDPIKTKESNEDRDDKQLG